LVTRSTREAAADFSDSLERRSVVRAATGMGTHVVVGGVKTACAVAAAIAVLGASSAAAGDGAGRIVLRLSADPAPARTSWIYAGLPSSVALGNGATSRTIDVASGAYTVRERPSLAGAPATLTALVCDDPSHDSRGKAASAVATIAVAVDETVSCTFTHRALGPPPTASALALAERFAPELRFAVGERYRPIAMQQYLGVATLRNGTPPSGTFAQERPTLFTLPVQSLPSYLDIRDAQPNTTAGRYPAIEASIVAEHPRPTVYWRLARQSSTGRLALEYWFLYLYNDFTDRHEADWEGVTVFLEDGSPIGASYSQHQGRKWTPWGAAPPDAGPTVYVGRGSHANYARPGAYRVRVCWTLVRRRCSTTTKSDSARGDGDHLTPGDYDLHELGGTGFTGGWGSGTYVLTIGRTHDRVTDPRRRSDYSNPFAAVPN
jgi:hypothetical protein